MADLTLQRATLRALLALPTPLLRALVGGGVVHVGGRTLDPRLQFLAAQARRAPPLTSLAPADARAASAQGLALVTGKLEPGVRVEHLEIPGGETPIRARAYRAREQDAAAPLMVYAHFGGGVIGDLDTCEAFCSILAAVAGCPVLSIDYRLAPEHRFPAGLEDFLAACRFARASAERFGAPAGHFAVGGDSMGGNFAAVAARQLREAGESAPVLQLLIYPAVDLASEAPSMTTYADAYPLTRATMEWFMGHYLNPSDSVAEPRLSPLRAPTLAGLPRAVVATAGFDPLLDQGEAYVRALRAAGVPVAYRCFDALAHGFTAFTGAVPAADAACHEIAQLVRGALAVTAE
ncbi:MAG: alpha/beta hydrolase [Caulobacteraceae bacterium]